MTDDEMIKAMLASGKFVKFDPAAGLPLDTLGNHVAREGVDRWGAAASTGRTTTASTAVSTSPRRSPDEHQ